MTKLSKTHLQQTKHGYELIYSWDDGSTSRNPAGTKLKDAMSYASEQTDTGISLSFCNSIEADPNFDKYLNELS